MRAGESGPQMGRSVEKQVRWFWRFVMMPVLFGLVGASINFATIQRGIIPKSCAIIIAGARAASSFFPGHPQPFLDCMLDSCGCAPSCHVAPSCLPP